MSQFKSCIIVLKPTSYFLSFVSEQLPDFDLPDDDEIGTDDTAYSLPVHEDDEALLEYLEKSFSFMFRNEVIRRLGKRFASKIKADFLDFLCCFKFEVHTETVSEEASLDDCQQFVCVKPRVVDVEWAPPASEDNIEVTDLLHNLDISTTNPSTSVVVKYFDKIADLKYLLKHYCRPLLKPDKKKKTAQIIQWPTVSSLQTFHKYFAVEVHTQLVHLH